MDGGSRMGATDARPGSKTVLFVHHSGKGGQQRGTSRREDVLDTVIALRYPKGRRIPRGPSSSFILKRTVVSMATMPRAVK